MSGWLFKIEPGELSIDDLKACGAAGVCWDGVRNYQARNMLRDGMRKGDKAFFYHSNCKEPGIVGVVEIVRAGYPDDSAWNPNSPYYDPKSTPAQPRWYKVDVRFQRKLRRCISLHELKSHPELADLALLRKGNRLSIMAISPDQWKFILCLE